MFVFVSLDLFQILNDFLCHNKQEFYCLGFSVQLHFFTLFLIFPKNGLNWNFESGNWN
ncbi:hypothetical protein LEP1GSC195_3479 [Leptospira wolbachii serovar Codice str. CDC]|uniref:Uncharacterized protein n=1 Tax=Leptospira wolbachii serovar Codice str. CDC TaxID=1218599 RepID=R9A1D2_9LEPT|nr:hypothetical protein LEP1GSC195_3479 [Leptospira wolbachii serovar Codice str. CDC]